MLQSKSLTAVARWCLASLTVASLVLALPGKPRAANVLIINGSANSTAAAPVAAAGFGVIEDRFRPGAIADHLGVPGNDISQIWVWNDGTFGNTGSAAVPSRAFSAADGAALQAFSSVHKHWVMDGLAWRRHASVDEQHLTQNIAMNLDTAGGGIVLGADDGSGAAIVQHVNQVATLFNFNPFVGTYKTQPGSQHQGGAFFSTPYAVDPTGVVGTTTYSELPHGLQPNGLMLGTAVFGQGTPLPQYGPSPPLGDEAFGGVTYTSVNHLVTTTIPGATIPDIPEPGTLLLLAATAVPTCAKVLSARRRGTNRR